MLNFDRIEQLSKENHKSLSFLSSSILGKYRTFLRDVRDHNGKITDEQISLLANSLNTTPAYIKGETDIKEKAAPVSGNDFSLDEVEFLKTVNLLNPDLQRLLLAVSKFDSDQLCRFADFAESFVKPKNNF